ncbi:uncharacterized protein K452DRAFT_288151 [Aplosporella prunicola CBS 121167]|uniref:Ribosomal protein S21 n=1 Tax=Aplosporella prunicola CBS 121167 TaxID=1176127 RepID=A0A6A6BG21_9PEZI|nr:uncharacterized protein K452DRAFT_288151 [Aplosporella prunicola CBS 121167]KAF2141451.1 hypothetical protein K452DRAFT_288151 [Aplosporella prunicola CBS 121167]
MELRLRSNLISAFARPCLHHHHQRQSLLASTRAFSVSAARHDGQSPSGSPEEQQQRAPAPTGAPTQPNASPRSHELTSLLNDALSFTKTAGPRTSRFKAATAQADNRTHTRLGFSQAPNTNNNANNPFGGAAARTRSSSAEDALNLFGSLDRGPRPGGLYERVGQLSRAQGIAASPKDLLTPPDPELLPRLGPAAGRSIEISKNLDLARGLRLLDQTMSRNRVRGHYLNQQFYERPGLKRKRLASMRWRNRFMNGFKATVERVQYLRRQGW